MLKKVLCIISLLYLTSCSVSKDEDVVAEDSAGDVVNTYDEFIPINDVEIPSKITTKEAVNIKVYYSIPSTCHSFKDIFVENGENNVLTYAIVSMVTPLDSCLATNDMEQNSLKFETSTPGDYTLRFWAGEKNDTPEYLIRSITVEN